MGSIREVEEIPEYWCELMTVPTYKESDRSSCETQNGVSLVSITSKLLVGVILNRPSSVRGRCLREKQVGLRPIRGCVDQIFTMHQILEHKSWTRLRLNKSVHGLGMCFASSKCEMLFSDGIESKLQLVFAKKELSEIDIVIGSVVSHLIVVYRKKYLHAYN